MSMALELTASRIGVVEIQKHSMLKNNKRYLVLYAYPMEPDGQSLQGDLLYRGLLKANQEAVPCHFKQSLQKDFYLKNGNFDVAFGVGFWGNVVDLIREPLK